ncbi:thermonuclease family protein [Variovorax sp. NFACC27]|jgi:endonuclease YncB( thermonuclease family)|uniref:thermonuclease family protein n=1 Tax=unclassified Variovorax TaxID=663243 RepID=UPI0008962A67|nr:thermonuclease family protein [Variovorax sp. YR750]MDP9606557.1 endonuclease YncB(thermonuclease family) [Variovorax paradoxus]SEF24723.1 Endonuclease YncB, thermonuclease family [Variovorax sp. NFACC28]SEG29954.1 Endonuclease YncB, thermonuclease family [Variovorax sp. NFACC29]SFC42262.1 Endonuclease YncB, thermonuclease family [Variovorax sp. NFACC26]SFF90734.1 Endonuclease YncB, thermonuclease family [Variovorax sp. NFACC27]
MHFRALLSSLLLLAFPLLSQAAPRNCLVVGISDGDTLTARCGRIGAYERVKVRIAAIDAPEKAQPYGQRSRQALSSICFGEQARITEIDTDRYGRTVADVSCNGEDAGSRMVADGWAWVYDYNRLATKRGGGLFKLQDSARSRRAGLWADPRPTPPWEWRKHQREEQQHWGGSHWGSLF